MKHLSLQRPLVVFDLETTGTDPTSDRVVEISVLRIEPDGSRRARTRRINPERPIPPQATAIHGIGDEDVRESPTFRQVARSLLEWLEGADLAGFNVLRFDLPLLDREFRECGLDLGLGRRKVVDAMVIFHRKEPRDLTAAVRFFLGREHEEAHGAEADVAATLEVLEAQLERYPDLPANVEELDAWTRPARANGAAAPAKFRWQDGEWVFAFGKHNGVTLRQVATENAGYLEWILQADFPDDAKKLVEGALRGNFPEPSDQST